MNECRRRNLLVGIGPSDVKHGESDSVEGSGDAKASPGSRPGQLARRLNMRANTVTTIVNALSDRGMLERVAAADDRRAVELTVTEAGRRAVLSWQAVNAAVLHEALSALTARQRRALAAAVPALDALARAVDRLADIPNAAD